MRRMVCTGCCLALTAVALVAFTLAGRSPARAQVPAGKPEEKTVEQVRKNIQALKGLPASQLNPVMDYIAGSLGVRCDHCHAIDSVGQGFEKDDLKPKGTARRMIQMVMDINTKNFGGRTEVSCYTCHRGEAEPTKLIPVPRPFARPDREEAATPPNLPTAENVLAMYEKALGGADAMKKIASRVTKGVSIDGRGSQLPLEIVQQAPDKYSLSVTMREGVQSTRAFNGTAGWMVSPRGTRAMPPDQAEEMRHEAALFPISTLRDLAEKLHVGETDTVNGATAYVLAAPSGAHATERFYIDSASGLLVRKVTINETMIASIPEQVDYSDYRTVDGVQIPFTVRTSGVDPRDSFTRRATSVEQNVPVDEKKFVMPEIKPRSR
jgi:photosynthetic reaction center cytochrome c subunit